MTDCYDEGPEIIGSCPNCGCELWMLLDSLATGVLTGLNNDGTIYRTEMDAMAGLFAQHRED